MSKTIDFTKPAVIQGAVFRLLTLITHYKKPLNFSPKAMEEAEIIIKRWLLVCELCEDNPPLELLKYLGDDCNTAGMIAQLHTYRKSKEGKKLYASLNFLGFFNGVCTPDEIKTIPEGQINIEGSYQIKN